MNEADRRREFEIDVLARLETLEALDREGAIAKNAAAMKETIGYWNKEFTIVQERLDKMENNFLNTLKIVKDIQESNTLALQRQLGHGPTT